MQYLWLQNGMWHFLFATFGLGISIVYISMLSCFVRCYQQNVSMHTAGVNIQQRKLRPSSWIKSKQKTSTWWRSETAFFLTSNIKCFVMYTCEDKYKCLCSNAHMICLIATGVYSQWRLLPSLSVGISMKTWISVLYTILCLHWSHVHCT